MSQFKKSRFAKVTAGVVGIASGVFMLGLVAIAVPSTAHAQSLTETQIQAILDLLSSFGADSATISNVNAALRGTAPSAPSAPSGLVCPATAFTSNLSSGDTGSEVLALQKFLNSVPGVQVAASGAGSPGNETTFFGSRTASGVTAFQEAFASDVLAPVGLSAGTGFWGPSSRAKANALCAGADDGGVTTPPPTGTGLSVSAAAQPAATLAPQNATRIPFTRFTVTAGASSVTIDSVVVERVGLAANSAFDGVVLVDEDGVQLGLSKTLNSNNQATVGEVVTIPAGTSKTFTVAGNMDSDLSQETGQLAGLSVVGINTSATISGSLPIAGAQHTVNNTLSIGSVTPERGNLDPNTSSTEEIGSTGKRFASIRLTAGSAEDVRVRSIRWNQSGSASAASDLTNVVVEVGGTEYPTTVSADGKNYTAVFGNGVVVEEGLSKDFTVIGDIVSGADRTAKFDISENTDVYVTGETFGYGITPSGESVATASDDSTQFTTGTPWFNASKITIGAGDLVITSSNTVPAGNVANGATDASLGSFTFDVTGEAVTWSKIAFTVATTGTGSDEGLTNMTLVDGNGAVLAGPQDPDSAGSTVTFSDSVTLPAGKNTLIVKGNLDNDWEADDTIQIKIDPDNDITSLKGSVSNNTLTASPSISVNAKTQTVQAGKLTVTPAASLANNTVIDGSNDVVFGRYVLDTTSSGEDVRVTVAQIRGITGTNADLDELSNLQLWDGSTALNTGSRVVNPSGNSGGADKNLTFTLDGTGLVVPKGTTKVIELRGSINASSTPNSSTTYQFDHSAGTPDWTVTGQDTGQSITETLSTGTGAVITIANTGTLTATVDASDPTEKWYVEGDTAVIGVFQFESTDEDMALTDLGLELDTASGAAADFAALSLWDGATKIVEKASPAFTNNEELFSFGLSDFVVPKNDDKELTVKATFAQIGTGQPGKSSHLLLIATTTTASQNKAKGLSSGTSADILGNAGSTTGARYFNALPKVAHVQLGSTVLANGTRDLYKFTVEATGDDLDLYKFTFNVATTGTTATAFKVIDDLGRIVKSGVEGSGTDGATVEIVVANSDFGSDRITLAEGEKRTYTLQASVTGAATGDSIVTQLEGDAAHIAVASADNGLSATNADGDTNDDFIWSDNNASSHSLTTTDWFNGFKVPGLPTTNLDQSVLSL